MVMIIHCGSYKVVAVVGILRNMEAALTGNLPYYSTNKLLNNVHSLEYKQYLVYKQYFSIYSRTYLGR